MSVLNTLNNKSVLNHLGMFQDVQGVQGTHLIQVVQVSENE